MASTSELIAQQYPFLAWLANDPEIGPLLRKAVDVRTPYSPEKFTAELMNTNWWKSQSDAQREWNVTQNTRPGEANMQRKAYWTELAASAKRMGVSLTSNQIKFIAEIGLQQGLPVDSTIIQQAITREWRGTDYGAGQIGVDAQSIRAMAQGEYFRPMSTNEAHELSRRIARGEDTIDSIRARLQKQASDRFPHLRDQLAAGISPAQIVEPFRQIVADELELGGAENVNMNNATWRKLLTGVRDPGTQKIRAMTESEVMSLARKDERFWKTANGRQLDNEMATSLANVFGKRKSVGVSF